MKKICVVFLWIKGICRRGHIIEIWYSLYIYCSYSFSELITRILRPFLNLEHIVKWKSLSCIWLFVTPWTIQSMEFSRPEYWVGSLPLLQGIFPTQRSNPGLPHCRQILYQLSHKGSPRILEWVAYPFSSGSSRPRNQTRVSCITGGFFINWAMRDWYVYMM